MFGTFRFAARATSPRQSLPLQFLNEMARNAGEFVLEHQRRPADLMVQSKAPMDFVTTAGRAAENAMLARKADHKAAAGAVANGMLSQLASSTSSIAAIVHRRRHSQRRNLDAISEFLRKCPL